MQFDECMLGDYRVFTGAIESTRGDGYIAALIVTRTRAQPGAQREMFRDESLACGYRWESAEDALAYAMNKAREAIRRDQPLLAA